MSRPEKVQAALRLMGNPYASLSLFDDASEDAAVEPSFQQKRTYFRKLENPHAFSSIFGDAGDDLWQAAAKRKKIGVLEQELDEVLRSYKRHVARTEWKKLMDYRSDFLKQASDTPTQVEHVINRLQKFRFSLLPDEKVEFNRAPADRIIRELGKILA